MNFWDAVTVFMFLAMQRFPRLIPPSVDVSNSSSSKVDSELVMAKEVL